MENPNFRQQQIDAITNKFEKESTNSSINIESIKKLAPEKRVSKLIELGVLCDLGGYHWGCIGGDRFYVFANINGIPIPMYKTSARTDGKRKDLDFFVFWGVQKNKKEAPWLIKGNIKEKTNNFYNIKKLEEISKILTESFDFDTDRIKKIENENFKQGKDAPWDKVKDVDNFVPEGKEIENDEKLNELLSSHLKIDFNKINGLPRASSDVVDLASSKILKLLEK
jgi:hypothetical protein